MKNLVYGALSALLIHTGSTGAAVAADAVLPDVPLELPDASSVLESAAVLKLWGTSGLQKTDDNDFERDWLYGAGVDLQMVRNFDPLSVQLDIGAQAMADFDKGNDDQNLAHGYATVHIFKRSPMSALGVFGGAAITTAVDDNSDDVVQHAMVGVEGAYFADQTIYSGQAGYVFGYEGPNGDRWDEFGFGRAVVRHFPTETSAYTFDLSLGSGDGDIARTWFARWGIEYEHQFEDSLWSVALGYEGFFMHEADSEDNDKDYQTHMARITFTRHFGGTTLYEQAVSGASTFDTPDFALPYGIVDDL